MAVADFEESYPKKSQYLEHAFPPVPWDAPVLVSKRFHYFGDAAIDLPKRLQHLVFRRRGCKLVTPSDARMLWTYVESVTNGFGRHGWPCNGDSKDRSSECGGN